ncbi:N-acetylglucosaminyldiphosphodolichol N-acetylglucosaminyltransferase anchoring subunit ALG14, partial [Ascoidea rubescens DSM 1968]
IMILLGSGGHTGEMIRILSNLEIKNKFKYITWVISSGDKSSLIKAQYFEKKYLLNENKTITKYLILPRARNISQNYFKSIFTTIYCFLVTSIRIFFLFEFKKYPNILICNGPGTSVPLCYIFFLIKLLTLGLLNNKIIYIESLARVNNLSLTGYLLYPIVDRFIVQWDKLHKKFRRSEYFGILV